jgi:hypothetical protein
MNWRSVLALIIIAFVGGGAAFAWLSSDGNMPWEQRVEPAATPAATAETAPPATVTAVAPLTTTVIQPVGTPAEAQLLVLTARRAVENGQSIGDLQGKLQATFGQAQPQALGVLARSTRDPLSNARLLKDFDAIAPALLQPTGTLWDRAEYEMANLFVLRRADAKPTARAAQIARVRDLIVAGDIAAAAKSVRALPGKALAVDWLAEADRAITVRQALDVLERSAALAKAPPPPPLPTPTPELPAPEAPSSIESLLPDNSA